MRNRFNEIEDTPEEFNKASENIDVENSDEVSFSTFNKKGAFFESISDEEIAELDRNTARSPEEFIQEIDPEYTEEELTELWDNDPGYVNDKVIYTYADEINISDAKRVIAPEYKDLIDESGELPEEYSEFYKQTGIHKVSWGKDAVEGTEKEVKLVEGTLVNRWSAPGNEGGTYLAEAGTDFNDLHLNVSEDKREKTQYEVIKPFVVIESVIADQPFDNAAEYNPTKQFRTCMNITDLVELGYLKRVENTDD